MADPVLNGKYIIELDELTSIELDAWLAFQPDEVSDEAFRISLENFIAALPVIPAVAGEYADIAALLAAQPGQTIDVLYHVLNPIADPAFNDLPDAEVKSVYYHLPGAKNGLLSDYNSIAFPKLGSDKNSKLGNSLDAFTFDIKFRTAEWSSNQATLQAAANALNLNSPQDLKLTGEAVKLITGNDPADISRVLFGLDGQLIFEPIPASKIQSDSSAADVTLNDSYQEILSITGGESISSALANIGLTAKSFATGSITAFADAGDGRITATSATHGLSEGDFIEIVNTSNYDGIYEIKAVPNINDFDITKAFVSTETGDWEISANREIAIDLRVNEISVKEFTRQIEGEGRLNFSEPLSDLVNTEDIDVFAKSNTAGEAIEILGTTQSSELKVINLDSEFTLESGSGTTLNVDKVDLGGILSAIATIRKDNGITFQILKKASGDDGEYQQFILSNTEFFQHFRSLAGDLSVAIGMEKSGAGVQAGGGLYISTSDLAGGADKVSGMNFGKTGLIVVGDIAGSGRAIGEMYDSDYHAKWELLSAVNRERIHPDIEWVELNQVEVVTWHVNPSASGGNGSPTKPFTVDEAMAAASENDIIIFQSGTYTDDITVTKDNLTFLGYNQNRCKINVTNFVVDTDAQQIFLFLENLSIETSTGMTQGTNLALVIFRNCIGDFGDDVVIDRVGIYDSHFGIGGNLTTTQLTIVRNARIACTTFTIGGAGTFYHSTIQSNISAAGQTVNLHTCDVDGDVNCANLTYNNTVITGTKVGTSSTTVNNQGLQKQAIGPTLAIPFDKLITKIDPLTITGATEFTVNTTNAEYGNMGFRRVTANGTNEPTFAAPFQKWLASRDYDNTNEVVNILSWWFDDISYYYAWGQAEAVAAPTILSMDVEDASRNDLVVVFSEVVTATNIGYTFRVDAGGRTLDSVSGSGTDTLTFVISGAAIDDADVLDLAYDSGTGDTKNAGLTELVTFTATTVDNNTDTTAPTLTTLTIEDASDDVVDCVFDEAVNITTAGWNIDTDGAALSISSILSGSGTTTPKIQLSRSVLSTETLNMDYDSGTGNTVDLAATPNELVSITDRAVTNNVASGYTFANTHRLVIDANSEGIIFDNNSAIPVIDGNDEIIGFEFWYTTPSSIPTTSNLLIIRDDNDDSTILSIAMTVTGTKLVTTFKTDAGNKIVYNESFSFSADTQYHIVVTKTTINANSITLYIDNSSIGTGGTETGNYTGFNVVGNFEIDLGNSSGGTGARGKFDLVRIFHHDLATDGHTYLWNSGSPVGLAGDQGLLDDCVQELLLNNNADADNIGVNGTPVGSITYESV